MTKIRDANSEYLRTPWWYRKSPSQFQLHKAEKAGDESILWKVGDLIEDRYEVIEVKKGGMGIVYVVYNPNRVDYFAIKSYRLDLFSEEEGRKALEKEAHAWIKLPYHPNIITADRFAMFNEIPCICMEYVWGQNLQEKISKKPLNVAEALDITLQICSAMMHLNRHGIAVHRDLSPNNILVTMQGKIKITDFGTAKALGVQDKRTIIGATLPYMAPEQFQGLEDIRSDIYSLGIVLYQALSGQVPFTGESIEQYLQQHFEKPLPSLVSLGHPIPCQLDFIVHKCTSKRPQNRYQNFNELMVDIGKLLGTLSGGSVSLGPFMTDNQFFTSQNSKGASLINMGFQEEGIEIISLFYRELQKVGIDPNDNEELFEYITEKAEKSRLRGLDCFKLGDFETALEYLHRSLDIVSPVDNAAWSSIGLEVDSSWKASVWCSKARAHAALKQKKLAWESCLRAQRFDSSLVESCKRALKCRVEETICKPAKHLDFGRLNQSSELYYRGRVFGEQGDHTNAIACYQKALKLNPNNIEALMEIGISLNEGGRYMEAIKSFEEVLARDPFNEVALIDEGFSLEKLHQYSTAVECYDLALKVNPGNVVAWQNKGTALLLLGNFKEAILCFEKVLGSDTKMTLALHGILRAATVLGDYKRAIQVCKLLIEKNEPIESIEAFQVINYLFESKNYFDAMELFAYFIFGGQTEQFVYQQTEVLYFHSIGTILDQLATCCEDSPLFSRFGMMAKASEQLEFSKMTWLDSLLVELISSGKDVNLGKLEDRAEEEISQRSQQTHSGGEVREQLNRLLQDTETRRTMATIRDRYVRAWGFVFETACHLYHLPLREVHNLMCEGIGYGQQELFKEAIDRLVKALRMNPFHSGSYNALGVALKRYGFPYLAILCYEESLRISYFDEVNHHNLGLAFMEVNRLDDAIAHFEEALRVKPSSASIHLSIALDKKKPTSRRENLHQSSLSNYNDLMEQGKVHLQRGFWKEAEKVFMQASCLKPEAPAPYLSLGQIYSLLGRNRTAVKTLEYYLELTLSKDEKPPNSDLATAYHALGLSYGHMGLDSGNKVLVEIAVSMFQRSISHDPENPVSYHLIGGLYLRQGLYEKAISNFLRAIELAPEMDLAYGELGLAYMEISETEKAIEAFKTALKLDPENLTHLENFRAAKSHRAK